MPFQIKDVEVIEGPSYEYVMEDGIGSTWNLLIKARLGDGRTFTHLKEFDMLHEKEDAAYFANKITSAGFIDLKYWYEGSPWDKYSTPQTYEEEKAEALEFERENPSNWAAW